MVDAPSFFAPFTHLTFYAHTYYNPMRIKSQALFEKYLYHFLFFPSILPKCKFGRICAVYVDWNLIMLYTYGNAEIKMQNAEIMISLIQVKILMGIFNLNFCILHFYLLFI